MGRLFLIAVRNLLQHKRRTLLLGGAIAGVTALLVILLGLGTGVERTMLESATTLMTGHVNVGGFFKVTAGQSAPVVTDYKKVLEVVRGNVPELDFVAHRGRGWAKLVSETGSVQVGIGGLNIATEPGFRRVVQMKEGKLDDLAQPNTILIFEEQAKKLDVKVGDALTLTGFSLRGANNTIDLRVVGVAKSLGLLSNFNVFVPEETLRALYQLNESSTGALLLYLKDVRQAPKVQANLRKVLADAGYGVMDANPQAFWMKFQSVNREDWTGQKLDVTTWDEEISFMQWLLKAINGLTGLLTFILLVIIAVGIMNTLWISIRERTREIGTLRAIGMQRRRVMLMFLIEAFVLALSGTVGGALIGLLLCGGANAAHIQVTESLRFLLMRDTLHFAVSFGAVAGSIALITFCTTAISVIPSYLAARLKPITAMHHIG